MHLRLLLHHTGVGNVPGHSLDFLYERGAQPVTIDKVLCGRAHVTKNTSYCCCALIRNLCLLYEDAS